MQFIESLSENDTRAFVLKGDWTVGNAAAIEESLKDQPKKPGLAVDTSCIGKFDTAGAWLVREYFPDAAFRYMSKRQKALMDFLPEKRPEPPQRKDRARNAPCSTPSRPCPLGHGDGLDAK